MSATPQEPDCPTNQQDDVENDIPKRIARFTNASGD